FANKACEGDPVASDGPVSVSGDGDYEIRSGHVWTPVTTRYCVPCYGGKENNEGVSSGCADEPVVVGPAAPRIATTQLPGSGVVVATFKDRASLAGLFGAHASGSVSWKLFANKACEGDPVASDGPDRKSVV